MRTSTLVCSALLGLSLAACQKTTAVQLAPTASTSIALTSDDAALWVTNPDGDSVSVIDTKLRKLATEIALGSAPPAVDSKSQRFDPLVTPRALAILPDDSKVYVAGQSANKVYVLDAVQRRVTTTINTGAEPCALVAAPDGSAVYVVNHQSATIQKIDPKTDQITATLAVTEHPFGASIAADGQSLFVTHFFLHAGLSTIDTATFTVRSRIELAEEQPDPTLNKLIPNGVARGLYAVVPRPGTGELWIPHLLLAIKTAQPDLDFQSTVFPTISRITSDGKSENRRLQFKPLAVPSGPGYDGAFDDVVSGPRALAFSPDGKFALLASSGSEDVMMFEGDTGHEIGLVRPLPSTMLEGIAIDHAGRRAYVDGRNSHDITVLALNPDDPIAKASVDGGAIDRVYRDPMPDALRLGQRLFYTANSAAFPITQNFWVSCSSCHLEGQTDGVTWLFLEGPRETPSNAGGPINTGFLLRQGLRNRITQYDATDNAEQGGNYHYSNPAQRPQLDALAAYINYAIPFRQNPNVGADGSISEAAKRGKPTFDALCASCHPGDYLTDSGQGNPTLDLSGTILLHDLGTCVTGGPFPDQPFADEVTGRIHTACDFDTPSIRGVFATPPYLHDGSAATLGDVVDRLPMSAKLSSDVKADLVQYLLTL